MCGARVRLPLFLIAIALCGQFANAGVPKKPAPSLAPRAPKSHPCDVKELSRYKKWLNQDVLFIITDREREDFLKICDDTERDKFVEAFWARRDPTPESPENEFKEEHYRRIAYSNEHFSGGTRGWKTDRGRVYIVYGPPDSIDSRPPEPKNSTGSPSFPSEIWHYQFISGFGQNVRWEFVDTCRCGEYHLRVGPMTKQPVR